MQVVLSDETGKRVRPVTAIAWYGGLCVTPTWWSHDVLKETQYTVTHIKSGGAIRNGMTEREAICLMIKLVERLKVDWTASAEAFLGNKPLDRRVKQIIKGVVGE